MIEFDEQERAKYLELKEMDLEIRIKVILTDLFISFLIP